VERGGVFRVGERDRPMELEATIYILDNGVQHHYMGERYLGGYGASTIELHGR
jgi:hypothetical protein